MVRATPDETRTDVAGTSLRKLESRHAPLLVDGVIEWGGGPHDEGMRDLVKRVKNYQLKELLNAMRKINEPAARGGLTTGADVRGSPTSLTATENDLGWHGIK